MENEEAPHRLKRAHKKEALFGSFLLAVLVFYTLPLLVAASNYGDVLGFRYAVFLKEAALITFSVILILSISIGVAKATWARWMRATIVFTLLFMVVCGFLLPLRQGLIDGEQHLQIFWSHAVVGGLVSWLAMRYAKSQCLFIAALFIGLYSLVYTLQIIKNSDLETIKTPEEFYELSDKQNVFVLSFDSIQGDDAAQLFGEDPNLSTSFQGFTLYPQTLALAFFTDWALLLTKGGRLEPEFSKEEYEKKVQKDFITSQLARHGYDVRTFSGFGSFEQSASAQAISFTDYAKDFEFYLRLVDAAFDRCFPAGKESANWVVRQLTRLHASKQNDLQQTLRNDYEALRAQGKGLHYWKGDSLDLKSFITKVKLGAKKPPAHFHHYHFTHLPTALDANCDLIKPPPTSTSKKLRQKESLCAFKLVAQLIERLKTLGVYESSLIVLMSDHGQKIEKEKKMAASNYPLFDSIRLSRFDSFLMIKPPHDKTDFRQRNLQTSLLDVASTLCAHLLPPKACISYEGFNLLGDLANIERAPRHLMISKRAGDKRDFLSFQWLNAGRDKPVAAYFNAADNQYNYQGAHLLTEVGIREDGKMRAPPTAKTGTDLVIVPTQILDSGNYELTLTYEAEAAVEELAGTWGLKVGVTELHINLPGTEKEKQEVKHILYVPQAETPVVIKVTLEMGAGLVVHEVGIKKKAP